MDEAEAGVAATRERNGETFSRLLDAIRKRISKHQFATWFQRTTLVQWDDSALVIGLPNRFYEEWFQRHFRGLITRAAEDVDEAPTQVRFEIVGTLEGSPGDAHTGDNSTREGGARPKRPTSPLQPAGPLEATALSTPPIPPPPPTAEPRATDSPLQLNSHYTFDNFIVGPSNRVAAASARAVAGDPGRAYNPLFLHGSVGLGKTHLLHAVCHEFVRQRPGQRICFLSCEEFTNEFVQALQRHDLEAFRQRFRNVHLLVIDDIHFLIGKERIQDEFFHTFNRLYQAHHQIVVSSDAPPAEIPTIQDRLVSRFKWGLVANIDKPEMETRMAIVQRKASLLGVDVPNDVVEFIAANFRNNIRELEGALHSVFARANVLGIPIDLSVAQEALEPALHQGRPAVTLDRITETVASDYRAKVSDLRSKRRSRSVSVPRQVVMFLARESTDLSLDEIGDHFGGRDHSTVLYAVRRIRDMAENDPKFATRLDRLRDRLGIH